MRLATLRRNRTDSGSADVVGTARLDRRTRRLTKRLKTGDIAVIDHVDLDRGAADELAAAGVAAVVNVAPSISGRFPNLGPELLAAAGIPLLDAVGDKVFDQVREGQTLRLAGTELYVGDELVASGTRQDAQSVAAAMAEARAGLSVQLEAFAANTMEYMRRERDLLIDGVGVPEVRTRLDGRHCLVVVRGYDYKADLDLLGSYIREFKPVLIGVDGGADALLEHGYTPDLIVGDMEAVSDAAVKSGAELVVHAYPDGRAPSLKRVEDLGGTAVTFPAAATSEDLALLLADERGAALIVAVGTHATLTEFLDKGRSGTASTFLTRLRIGGKLVDAKAVSRLYRQNVSGLSLFFLVLAALLAMAAAMAVSTVGRSYLQVLAEQWDSLVFQLQRLFT